MMCSVCGCGEGEARIEGHECSPQRDHDHHRHEGQTDDYGQSAARAHAPDLSQSRIVQIDEDILAKNSAYADTNRHYFSEHGIVALNLVSSPGSGKTTLLTRTVDALKAEVSLAVIEGDQQTSNDAERIPATGVRALHIDTGKGCHLDAHMVGHALDSLKPEARSVLSIENVGNVVCPAAFDLGEAHKVVILSVTEGEDKPVKYPDTFHAADLIILNKVDLLPYVEFDVDRCIDYAPQVNPGIQALELSATSGGGLNTWCQWIEATRQVPLIGNATQAASA